MNQYSDNNNTDQELVDRVLRGDTEAFTVIIKGTERLITQIVFKMISRSADRSDLIQDIYLNAFHKLSTFRFQSKLSTWLAQIAYNACLTYAAKKKLVLLAPREEEDEAIDRYNVFSNEVEKQLSQKELAGILEDQLNKLTPLYKTMITLYHQEDLSYIEISEITALPIGSVKSYLFRARKILRHNVLLSYKKEEL